MSLVKAIRNIKRRQDLIITPRLELWLEIDGGSMGFGDDQTYDEVVRLFRASQRNAQRSQRFGASSRGSCHRKQVYGYLGMRQAQWIDAHLQNIFNDGTWRHVRWQMMGLAAGVFTHVEFQYSLPDWRLGLSMDAINYNEEWVFELKGTGSNINAMAKPEHIPPHHLLQIHTYLFATGWDRAVYVAEAKQSNHWSEIVVPRDDRYIRMVKHELRILNDAIDTQTIPPVKPECRKAKGEFRNCPYAANCLAHDSQGSPWPDDEEWPRDTGTSVQVGRRIRSS